MLVANMFDWTLAFDGWPNSNFWSFGFAILAMPSAKANESPITVPLYYSGEAELKAQSV